MTHSLIGAHRGIVCVHTFIGVTVSVYTSASTTEMCFSKKMELGVASFIHMN